MLTVVRPWRNRVRSPPVTRSRPQAERSTAIIPQAYFFFDGAAGFLAALAVSILRWIRALSLAWLFRRFIFGVRRLSPRPMAGSYITSAGSRCIYEHRLRGGVWGRLTTQPQRLAVERRS